MIYSYDDNKNVLLPSPDLARNEHSKLSMHSIIGIAECCMITGEWNDHQICR